MKKKKECPFWETGVHPIVGFKMTNWRLSKQGIDPADVRKKSLNGFRNEQMRTVK